MRGERLMCIWQAVLANDVPPYTRVTNTALKAVILRVAESSNIHYSESRFNEVFKTQQVEYENVKEYVERDLCPSDVSLLAVLKDVEYICWQMCKSCYQSEALGVCDLERMWYVFNRVCSANTYPAVMATEDCVWLCEKLAASMHATWDKSEALPDNGMTFQQLIDRLDRTIFTSVPASIVSAAIEQVYNWLVLEVMKAGWLHKRTRRQSRWSQWEKRWFVMLPRILIHCETASKKSLKGSFILEKNTSIENSANNVTWKFGHRFTIKTTQYELQLCALDAREKATWMRLLSLNVNTVESGITPIIKQLRESKGMPSRIEKRDVAQTHEQNRKSPVRDRQNTHVSMTKANNTDVISTHAPMKEANKSDAINKANHTQKATTKMDDAMEIKDVAQIQRDKVRAVFVDIDKNKSGYIDRGEFYEFLQGLGADVDRNESDALFITLDKDNNKNICFDEFYEFFVRMMMGHTNTAEEAKLTCAFMNADNDGSGAVDFREFVEFAYENCRGLAMQQLMNAFDKLDSDGRGEIKFSVFKQFFEDQNIENVEINTKLKTSEEALQNFLKNAYGNANTDNLANYIEDRWKAFAGFKRTNSKGKIVMTGEKDVVDDITPGQYSLVDLACFNDLPPITPKHAVIKGVTWTSSTTRGKSGRAIFPADFDGHIPVDIATNEHLAYYGATLASGNQIKVSLLYRHGIQDFNYQSNYLEDYVTDEGALGGAGIEKHEFAHLDCPMDDDAGLFVIAKFDGDELHITGFKIPKRHTLYLPGGVIHSNDYLKGTWRTMLSDEADIDHVQLYKRNHGDKADKSTKFTFNFVHY